MSAETLLREALAGWFAPPSWCAAADGSTARSRSAIANTAPAAATDSVVLDAFREHGGSLVRLAGLFVDDRNAAEDLVQEAFIRLSRGIHRLDDRARLPAYLRSIVINLARDHNRRGLVSLRHRSALAVPTDAPAAVDEVELRDDQRRVVEALRRLPDRQRVCLVLRYYDEMGVDEIATSLGVSRNSVKTHLQRGLAALERTLGSEAE